MCCIVTDPAVQVYGVMDTTAAVLRAHGLCSAAVLHVQYITTIVICRQGTMRPFVVFIPSFEV